MIPISVGEVAPTTHRTQVEGERRLHDGVLCAGSIGPRFHLEVGAAEAVGWIASTALADPTSGAMAEAIDAHAHHRGIQDRSDAASLLVQRWAHRVCGALLGPLLLVGVAPDLGLERVRVRLLDGSPHDLAVPDLVALDGGVTEAVDHLIDDHLGAIVNSVRSVVRIGAANLWGNVAAGVAGVFSTLSQHTPDGIGQAAWARHCAASGTAALDTRPELRNGGRFVVLSRDERHRAFFERSTCCRWYRIPDGGLCSWCSRRDAEERRETFLSSLAS